MSLPLWAKQLIRSTNTMFFVSWEMQYNENCSYGQLVIGSFITTTSCSCITSGAEFWWNIKPPRSLSPPAAQIWHPVTSAVSPKLKSPLKGKRFQTIDEIQENMKGKLMVIGRTVWGPKVSTLKGTGVSLSHVQCFRYLVSSSINVSIFHITWLDTFWTDLIYTHIM